MNILSMFISSDIKQVNHAEYPLLITFPNSIADATFSEDVRSR